MKTDSLKKKAERKDRKDMIQYVNLQLASLGQPLFHDDENAETKLANSKFIALTGDFINSFREKTQQQKYSLIICHHLKDVQWEIL